MEIGENINLKLRREKEKLKEELEQVKIQRDIALRKLNKEACGNCAMYSNRRSFCGVYKTQGVKDTFTCNKWRKRHFKR